MVTCRRQPSQGKRIGPVLVRDAWTSGPLGSELALHRSWFAETLQPVAQPALAGGTAVQCRRSGVAREMVSCWPSAAGHLVAECPQAAAHGCLAEGDLPRLKALLPGTRGRPGDLLLGVGVPVLALGNLAAGDLVRLGHCRVVLLGKEVAQLGEARCRVCDEIFVP